MHDELSLGKYLILKYFIIWGIHFIEKSGKSFISSCFGISACFHPAWTIEEHRAQDQAGNVTLDDHDDDQLVNYTAKVGYKGLWQECLWNQKVRILLIIQKIEPF